MVSSRLILFQGGYFFSELVHLILTCACIGLKFPNGRDSCFQVCLDFAQSSNALINRFRTLEVCERNADTSYRERHIFDSRGDYLLHILCIHILLIDFIGLTACDALLNNLVTV